MGLVAPACVALRRSASLRRCQTLIVNTRHVTYPPKLVTCCSRWPLSSSPTTPPSNGRLVQVVGDNSDTEVAGKLAINGAVGEDVFAKAGAHLPAEVGAIMSRLTALGDKVDWSTAVFTWQGPNLSLSSCIYLGTHLLFPARVQPRTAPNSAEPHRTALDGISLLFPSLFLFPLSLSFAAPT